MAPQTLSRIFTRAYNTPPDTSQLAFLTLFPLLFLLLTISPPPEAFIHAVPST